MPKNNSDKEQTDYDDVCDMADRLKLKGREQDRYIHQHMTGLGYKMVPSYVRPDNDDDEDNGGRFSFRRGRGSREDDDDLF